MPSIAAPPPPARTLLDHLHIGGSFTMSSLVTATMLVVLGICILIARPHARIRGGFCLICLLPALIGVLGAAITAMRAFRTLGTSGLGNARFLFVACGEVLVPLVIGTFGTALALTLGAIGWLRPLPYIDKGPKGGPPALPAQTS